MARSDIPAFLCAALLRAASWWPCARRCRVSGHKLDARARAYTHKHTYTHAYTHTARTHTHTHPTSSRPHLRDPLGRLVRRRPVRRAHPPHPGRRPAHFETKWMLEFVSIFFSWARTASSTNVRMPASPLGAASEGVRRMLMEIGVAGVVICNGITWAASTQAPAKAGPGR